MPSTPQLAHLTCSAEMRELQEMPLVRSASSASLQGSQGGCVLKEAESLMVAANTANGMQGYYPVVCAITGNTSCVEAEHVLPHSYWSTARQHEWLFYAGAIPNGNARYRGLDKFKCTEKNTVWLFGGLAGLMEPMTGGMVILVPRLASVVITAEQRLVRYEENELVFAGFTSPELLVEWPHQVTASERTASTFPYSLWIAPPGQDELTVFLKVFMIKKDGQLTQHDASTDREMPVSYSPPLPRYDLCVDPIIASIAAWTTIRDCLLEGSLALADKNTFALLDYFLALCETETPTGWRSLSRPDSLPPARPSHPAVAEQDNRRRVNMGEDWAPPLPPLHPSLETGPSLFASASLFDALPEEDADEDAAAGSDDEDVWTPEECWNDHRRWIGCDRHNFKCVDRMAQRLDDLEDGYIDEARRVIRRAFEERCCHGFSAAMRWLRSSEADALAIDEQVRCIKATFISAALPIVDAWMHDAEGPNPTPDVAAWLDTSR